MARLTITLSDERHRALREAAVQRGKTIGQLIEESLQFYGIKSARSADELVAMVAAGTADAAIVYATSGRGVAGVELVAVPEPANTPGPITAAEL